VSAKKISKIACGMHVTGPRREVKERNDVSACSEGRKRLGSCTHAYNVKIKSA